MKLKKLLFFGLAVLAASIHSIPALAGDMSYSTLVPQSGENALTIGHKQVLAAAPKLYTGGIASSGTTNIAAATLDRVIVSTPGGAGANVILTDGTNPVATVSTLNQTSLAFGIALKSGTLTAVTTGTANITLVYR